jgi:hypothetical protein
MDQSILFDGRILASIAVKLLYPIAGFVIRPDEPIAAALITL